MKTPQPRPFVLFQNGGIGDFLMFIFLAEQIWNGGGASHIYIVVPRMGKFFRELIEHYPYISILEISRRHPSSFLKLAQFSFRTTTVLTYATLGRLPMRLKLLAWCMTRFPGSRLVGFQDSGPLCRLLYTQVLTYDTCSNYADVMRTTAHAVGGSVDKSAPRLLVAGHQSLLPSQPYVVLHPSAGISARRRSFATDDVLQMCRYILEHHPAMHIYLSSGPEKREWIDSIYAALSDARVSAVVGMSGQELATLIQHARLYIGPDTGITHLACFVGAPVLEIANYATAHWLCFYEPSATVLYRLEQERDAHTTREYLEKTAPCVLRPFGDVPAEAACDAIGRMLSVEDLSGDA